MTSSSETPPPSDDPTWDCPNCGWAINDEIIDDAPACPHGWQSLEGMALPDVKALFAEHLPEMSLDPVIEKGTSDDRS